MFCCDFWIQESSKCYSLQSADSKIRITKLDISNCKKKDGETFMLSVLLLKKKDKKHFFARLSF